VDEEAKRWLAEAARVIDAWRQHYSHIHPCMPRKR
jgi:hypothetical protein